MRVVRMPALMVLCIYLLTAGVIEQTAAQGRNQLEQGEALGEGDYLKAGDYRLVMQTDCNLVIYVDGDRPVWSSLTVTEGVACFFILQLDGNAVIYAVSAGIFPNNDVSPRWSSGTCCRNDGDHVLVLQEDGNLVIYNGGSNGNAIWASDTNGRQ